ncbi:unnamed protein product [Paramecium pentaurelia]|uniref:Uncharacterized protein n=1 Tax=Paramecium pentaurelia TaxID=43138 RepID=A0A8S1VDI5_9CILI|nr:unnamed protein product [Paramecium pentaurelia]
MKPSQTFRIKSIKTTINNNHQQKSLQMSLKCQSLTNKTIKQKDQIYKRFSQIQPLHDLQKSINIPCRQSIASVTDSQISADEEFEIWDDNQDLRVKKIILDDKQSSISQFLQLYKARYGGFPGQRQAIQNEEVIKTAISYASSSKKLFKKYFPSKFVVFEDQNDYSQPYDIEDDQHFQTFNKFFRNKKLLSTHKVSYQSLKKTQNF